MLRNFCGSLVALAASALVMWRDDQTEAVTPRPSPQPRIYYKRQRPVYSREREKARRLRQEKRVRVRHVIETQFGRPLTRRERGLMMRPTP